MKIDPGAERGFALNHAPGDPGISRTNEQIEVAIGPERRLRIQPRDAPTFQEDRLDAVGADQPKELLDFALMNVRLQREQAKRLMQQLARRCFAQRGFAYAPPT